MQTLGVGVDIIENSRIKKSIKNKKFLSRIYSKIEIKNSSKNNNKSSYLTGQNIFVDGGFINKKMD